MQKIPGEISGGRFGTAVMCLGDIDYDGYGDIAVGAPYEEETGGSVYIFNGNRNGVSRKYSQRLIGTIFSPVMRGFGISISEPRDVNRDNHSDIAVGAYLSGDVVLLKSMPVVVTNVTLSYPQKIKLLRNTTSFLIELSISYEGVYVPECLRKRSKFNLRLLSSIYLNYIIQYWDIVVRTLDAAHQLQIVTLTGIIAILQIDQLYGRAVYRTQKTNGGTHRLFYTLKKSKISHSQFEIYLVVCTHLKYVQTVVSSNFFISMCFDIF